MPLLCRELQQTTAHAVSRAADVIDVQSKLPLAPDTPAPYCVLQVERLAAEKKNLNKEKVALQQQVGFRVYGQ